MKIYKIKVNGKTYKVELEAVEEVASEVKPALSAAPAPKAEPAPAASSGEGQEVLAPIQGVINKILVKVGQKVAKGETVVIVEAMKLENEVSTPFAGVVSEILVTKGQSVSNKQVLIKIK